jgi:hypothetical protein
MKLPRCRRPCRPLGHPAADSGGGAAVLRRWESAVGAAPCFRPCRLQGSDAEDDPYIYAFDSLGFLYKLANKLRRFHSGLTFFVLMG